MAGNTVSTIYINGREAENSLKGLTALAAKLSNELKRAELGTEDFANKAEKWRNVTALIDDQKQSLKEYMDTYGKAGPVNGSLSQLRQKHQELVKTLDELEVGTKEWNEQLEKVQNSEKNINKVNQAMKAADQTVVGSLEHTRQLHQILVKTLDQLEVGTAEWLDQLNTVKESEKKMAALNQTMKGVDKTVVGSLDHMKQQHQALVKTLDGLEVGTKEWFDQLKKIGASEKDIADLNKLMQEQKAGVKATTGSLEDMRKKHQELVKTLDVLEVNTAEWVEQLKKVKESEKDLDKINSQLRNTQNHTESAGMSFGKMGAMVAGAFAVENLIQFGRETIELTTKFEQSNIAFETMLGSKLKAETLQSELMELAAKTPFELMQVQDATKQFLAYGFAAEDVVKQVSMIGDIAAGVGLDKLPLITLAYGQVKAATRLMGQELNQFTQNGIPMLEELAKVTGKTPAQVKKMVEEGKIGFPLVQKALQNMTSEGGRFHNMMAKQAESLGGVYSTFKDTFIQNVQLPIGNFVGGPSKAFLKQMTAMMQSSDVTGGKFEKMREAMEGERVELSTLVNRIAYYNAGNKARGALLEELKKKYPTFLKNMDIEKVSNEQLRDRLQEVNKQYIAKIVAIEASKKVVAQQKLEEASGEYLAKAQVRQAEMLGKAQDFLSDKSLTYEKAKAKLEARIEKGVGLFAEERTICSHLVGSMNSVTNATERLNAQHQYVNKTMEKQTQIVDNLKKQYPEIAGSLDDIFKPKKVEVKTPDAKPAVDEEAAKKAAEKAKNELDQQQEKLKRLREQIITFKNDIKQINGTHDEAEAVKIKEKYDKQIAEAEENLKSKNPKIVSDSREIIAQLNSLRDEELLSAQKKHLRDVQDFLKQHQEEVAAAKLGDDEKELQSIRKKYAKQLKEVTELEANNVAGANEAKTQLEAVINAEIEAKEAEQKEKADAKEIAENEKNLQERLKREHEYAQFTGNLQQEELDQLEIQYMNIMALAEKEGRDTTAVKEAYNKKKKEIDEKYNKDRLKDEKKTAEALADAEFKLKIAKYKAMEEGAGMLRSLVGQNTVLGKALFAFEKAMAIGAIVVNLAKEKSAIRVKNALIPAPLGPTLTATETTMANINAAGSIGSIVAQAIPQFSAPQKFDGGYHYVQGQTDGKTYRARYIGERSTGMLPSSPSIVLASERGPEYYVNNTDLSIPEVDWHVRAIDNIVHYGRPIPQYEQGGYSTPPTTASTTAPAPMFPPELLQLIQNTNQLMNQLISNGIKSEAVIGYSQVRDINTALTRINKIQS